MHITFVNCIVVEIDTLKDREVGTRASKRRSKKLNRYERDYETCSTAAYHTETQPRTHRATRSYAAGDVSDEDEHYEFLNRSLELKRPSKEEVDFDNIFLQKAFYVFAFVMKNAARCLTKSRKF